MYDLIADICNRVDGGESLKNILYGEEKHLYEKDLPAIRALVDTTLRNKVVIDDLINRTCLCRDILFNEAWDARVLVAELVFGRKSFSLSNKVGKKVFKYRDLLKEFASDLKKKETAFVPRYCRINTISCTKETFHNEMSSNFTLKEVGGKSELTYEDFLKVVRNLQRTEYIQDYHFADLYIFHPKVNLTALSLYQENKIILQDKASCLVAPLLAPTPGSLMIDMCAAPGFKTQHLSSIVGSSGLILAIDINKERYNILANTRINYNLSNVMTFNADALHLPDIATKCIEYVLLDAPCSGSGVVSNFDFGTEERRNKQRLSSLHNLQAYLLRTVLTRYHSARRIVYSTCSMFEEENESVIEELLNIAKENKFVLVNLKNHLQDFGTGLNKYSCGSSCIRLMPDQSCTNGFFIALFERTNPPNPIPRTEFYKNLNQIIDGISCRKKRKADESMVMNGEGEGNKNVKKKEIFSDNEDDKEEETNMKLKKTKKDSKDVQNNLNLSVKQETVKQKVESESSSDSSGDDEVKQTLASPPPTQLPLIRVVRSPLLKNPINTIKEQKEDSDDDDDDEDDDDEESSDEDKKQESLQEINKNSQANTGSEENGSFKKDDEEKMRRNIVESSFNKTGSEEDNQDQSWKQNENISRELDNEQNNENFSPRRYSNSSHERFGNSPHKNRDRDDDSNRKNDYYRNNRDNFDYRGSGKGFGWRGGKGRGNFRPKQRRRSGRGRGNSSW